MASFSIPQFEDEPFWRYFNRVQDSLPIDYRCELWEICEVIYALLDDYTRNIVQDMHNGEFRAISLNEAWDFFNWLAQDTYECDMGTHPRRVQPNDGIPLSSSSSCNEMPSMIHDSYSPNECMNYNDFPTPCDDYPHLSSFDSSPSNSSCDAMHSNVQNLNP